ncbi:MAG TPA: hypothetical protein VJG30_04650 [Candidatus Nanoarchaeia archaeon]|nr:hypothetical protein [Candidatus Nanoarchaeia archaeon]
MRIGFSRQQMEERREHMNRWWEEELESDAMDAEQASFFEGYYAED